MSYPLKVVNVNKRECGSCQACCEAFKIPELSKPAFASCKNQCEKGCGIYENRPSQCSQFECLYLTGNLEGNQSYRPDNLGVILYNSNSGLSDKIGPHLCAIELYENAFVESKVNYLLNKIGKKLFIYGFKYNNTGYQLFGPEQQLNKVKILLGEISGY